MASHSHKLDRIKIQTARMLEIYSLVRRELEKDSDAQPLHTAGRDELNRAISTIAANMKQLQHYFASAAEDSSAAGVGRENGVRDHSPGALDDNQAADKSKTAELDELVQAVLKWHMQRERDPSS